MSRRSHHEKPKNSPQTKAVPPDTTNVTTNGRFFTSPFEEVEEAGEFKGACESGESEGVEEFKGAEESDREGLSMPKITPCL
ncbi:hypothetical protein [Streptomyces sp. NPDC048142]|uniref:hypothetical protein n=1 Tax=Streptomyces sp. NPDC048142 TaxID=3365501 RepID=UPI00371DC6CF